METGRSRRPAYLWSGLISFPLSGYEGGGIYQAFNVSSADAGDLTFSLNIAVSGMANSSGGWFQLFVDDVAIADHNFGPILVGTPIERSSLTGTRNLLAGSHTLSIQMRRNFRNVGGHTPIQYLDNITISSAGFTLPPGGLQGG
ncbi:MAG: hypothetical protein ACE5F7_08510, partial [Nitrospiria bacterium]